MRILKPIVLAFISLFTSLGLAQTTVVLPQVNVSGNVGCVGFPCVNTGTIQIPADANYTVPSSLSQPYTSASSVKFTSAVSLTATRNIIYPSGRFPLDVENATSGGQSIQIIGSSGTGVTIANGQTVRVWNDGTNFMQVGGDGGGSATFDAITSGTNTAATMVVGSGAALNPSGTGVVNANQLEGAGVPANTAVAGTNSSGQITASTSAGISSVVNQGAGMETFGDSITAGTGSTINASGYADGWANQLQTVVGGFFKNQGYSGDQAVDESIKIHQDASPSLGGTSYTTGIGTNDVTQYGTNANLENVFQRVELANLVRLSTPATEIYYGQTLGCGSFTNDDQIVAGMGIYATSNGASCSTSLTTPGGVAYLAYHITDGNTGSFTLSVDGTPVEDPFNGTSTFYSYGDGGAAILTQNGFSTGIAAVRIGGLSAGSHTFLLTSTSSTGKTTLDWIATPVSDSQNPYVAVISLNYQNNANNTTRGIYEGYVSALTTEVAADGGNIHLIDTADYLVTNCGGTQSAMFSTCYADTIHPNQAGHNFMFALVNATIPSALKTGTVRDLTASRSNATYQISHAANPGQFAQDNAYGVLNTASGFYDGHTYNVSTEGQDTFDAISSTGDFMRVGAGVQKWCIPTNSSADIPYLHVASASQLFCPFIIQPNHIVSLGEGSLIGDESVWKIPSSTAYSGSISWSNNAPLQTTGNDTSATSGNNVPSYAYRWRGNCWTGTSSFISDIGFALTYADGTTGSPALLQLQTGYGCGPFFGLDFSQAANGALFGGVQATSILTSYQGAPGAATLTASNTGGTIPAGTYYTKVAFIDSNGATTPAGTESAGAVITTSTGSLIFSAFPGSNGYLSRIYIGTSPGAENVYFDLSQSAAIPYTLTALPTATATPSTANTTGALRGASITTTVYAVSSLPAAANYIPGTMVTVRDSLAQTAGTCVGGGSYYMIAITDGTGWSCH